MCVWPCMHVCVMYTCARVRVHVYVCTCVCWGCNMHVYMYVIYVICLCIMCAYFDMQYTYLYKEINIQVCIHVHVCINVCTGYFSCYSYIYFCLVMSITIFLMHAWHDIYSTKMKTYCVHHSILHRTMLNNTRCTFVLYITPQ